MALSLRNRDGGASCQTAYLFLEYSHVFGIMRTVYVTTIHHDDHIDSWDPQWSSETFTATATWSAGLNGLQHLMGASMRRKMPIRRLIARQHRSLRAWMRWHVLVSANNKICLSTDGSNPKDATSATTPRACSRRSKVQPLMFLPSFACGCVSWERNQQANQRAI